MFSVVFPGQGSQVIGMGKEFFEKYDLVKELFKEADDTLSFSLSKLILEGSKDELDLTKNTQQLHPPPFPDYFPARPFLDQPNSHPKQVMQQLHSCGH